MKKKNDFQRRKLIDTPCESNKSILIQSLKNISRQKTYTT